MQLHNPAPGRKVTSPYGIRKHPISGAVKKHRGTDYGGTFRVLSAGDGVVHKISYNGNKRTGGGHVVIIKHAPRLFTVYYHGRERTELRVGQRVVAGQFVYMSGSTGASTGPHLHFEVRTGINGVWGSDVDPTPYLNNSAPAPSVPTGIPVSGKLDKTTWKAWQDTLKEKYGYTGMIDGIPGKMSWSAVQGSVNKYYKGRIDGVPGPQTHKAVQQYLKELKFYSGAIDGVWGRLTISALQSSLNAKKY